MKRLIEDESDGIESLLGERVTFWCVNYIYTGKLVGVNDTCVKLNDAFLVYETGPLDDGKGWQDAQPYPNDLYIQMSAVESFGVLK